MTIPNPQELRTQGFAVLVSALGWANAVRFMQQYETGFGNYTQERDSLLPDWDVHTLMLKARERTGG